MNEPHSETIEQVLFQRMGVSVEEAIATGADLVDEQVSEAARSGVDVEARISSLGQLLGQLTEPATVSALSELLNSLPQLVQLAKLATEMPKILATVGDVLDDYQQQCVASGIDVEKALSNGIQAALWLGSRVDEENLEQIGDLLDSDILNPEALRVIDRAAKSLNMAQQDVGREPASKQIGMLGLISALRNPEIQRSLGFAVQFGKCFGKNLETDQA